MSTTNIIEISEKSDDTLYPTNELEDVNKYNTSDPVIAKLSKVICRLFQKDKAHLKQKKVANAYITIFTCILCVVMSAVIITKLLEDGDRMKFYNTFSELSLPPKVYENQNKLKIKPALLVKSSDPKFLIRDTLGSAKNVTSLNNSTAEVLMNNKIITQTSESNFNATTQDTLNEIPTVEPLTQISSSSNLNTNNVCIFSYFFIVLLISNYRLIM